jgi:hypothetical protein
MTPTATEDKQGRKLETVRGIVFEQEGAYVVVCLDRYLMTVAKTEDQVPRAIERMLMGHIVASMESGQEPFEGLPAAPPKYWRMYQEASQPATEDLLPTPPPGLLTRFPSLDFRRGMAAVPA